MSSFEGAHDLILNNCTVNTVGGDGTFNSFTSGGPLFVNSFIQHMTGSPLPLDFQKKLEKHILSQNISNLPRASAAYDDYATQDKRRVACFEGTREALLEEIAKWILSLTGPRLYLLWGIAGVGKSTVAQTVAERADDLHCLGASFFFSRGDIERKNAKMFFTMIAFHLCIFSEDFARAVEEVLLTQRGHAAMSKKPLEQLNILILEPLRNFNHQDMFPIVMVIDALDECDDEDGSTIFIGLTRLVQELPFFKVILTTRPQPHLQHLIQTPNTQTQFHLQNIEEKIVDNDIRLYLEHCLSPGQVQECLKGLRSQWSASHEEIMSLVRGVGRLFIIASTAVLFILDKAAGNPASRMKTLEGQFAQNRTPLGALNEFYTVILRSAVPVSCECDIVDQYQLIVGTVIIIQDPLPVKALAVLIGLPEQSIYAVLRNLQSVISISRNNIPHVYHKSFPDYLTDDTCCKDINLRIAPCTHHTRIAVRCLQFLNTRLKKNMLGIGTHQGFVDNSDRLREENITTEQLIEKIPSDLRYACIYWADHVEGADTENVDLTQQVETFVMEHLLHWLEALSWINKIAVAYPAVHVLSKYMMPTSTDTSGIISDALRFIARFSEQISRSALYTYYCALPFTPTDRPLYRIYSKEMLCRLEGTPTQWDALISSSSRRSPYILDPVFSHDASKFWLMEAMEQMDEDNRMALLDAESGMDIRSYEGYGMALAHDFSVAAVSNGCTVTLWSMADNVPVATVISEGQVDQLALSFDGARLAVTSSDGTVGLWDSKNVKLIASLKDYPVHATWYDLPPLGFAARGYRLAIISDDGTIWLWDGEDGRLVARLDYESKKYKKFAFSCDGRRLAALTEDCNLTLWDAEKGTFIDAASNVGDKLAMSEDGSFIATGGRKHPLQLWGGNPLLLVHTLDIYAYGRELAISCDILAIAYSDNARLHGVKLYDVNNCTVVATLELNCAPLNLALSPDCTRLVIEHGFEIKLFDVALLKALIPAPSQKHKSFVTALAFSPNSSRLACGLNDGTIEIWDTNCAEQSIAAHQLHSERINTLAFALDGELFISGSNDKTIGFWDGNDARLMERTYIFTNAPTSAAFSHHLLAVATRNTITLFTYESLFRVDVLENGARCLAFSGCGTLLAGAIDNHVTVWNVAECAPIATFTATKPWIYMLTFSPDSCQLGVKSVTFYEDEGYYYELFDIVNKRAIEHMGCKHPSWVPGVMNGLLISLAGDADLDRDTDSQHLIGQPSRGDNWIGVLWFPNDVFIDKIAFGSSIVALVCSNGHILFVRFPTTSIH